jgi:hypothetical protein
MTRDFLPRRSACALKSFALATALSLSLVPAFVRAQDAVRPSLAGESAAEARRQDIDRLPYNLLLGPVRFRVSATVGVEWNDNINLSDDGTFTVPVLGGGTTTVRVEPEDDFIFRPQLNFDAIWPITQLNTLRFDLGLSYAFYVDHSNANTNGILISPGSQVAFDIFVGDFRINIHDRPQLQQDPVAELALSNVVDYGRFENTAGISVLWDLNKALLSVGYDHYNYVSTVSDFDYLNRNAEILSASLAILATSYLNLGPEGYAVFTRYDDQILNDSDAYNVGGFIETQITHYLKLRVAGGYQEIDFDRAQVNFFGFTFFQDRKSLQDWYGNVLITHRLNASIQQSLTAGHESQLGINSNFIELNFIRHTITWNIIRNTLLSTEFFYEDADESGGFINEHLHRYGGALTLGYQLTPHVTLGGRYQYTQKDSDVVARDYKQNRVSIDGTYSF